MELEVLVLRLCGLVELGLGTLGLLRHGDRVSSRVDADGEGSPICSSRETVGHCFLRHTTGSLAGYR